jgi:hypothetical protein
MKCLSTRTRPDGMKARRYELDDGSRITTIEIPVTVIRGVGMKKVQQQFATWQRGEDKRAESRMRRERIESLLREKVKPLAIADEVGVTEQRVRQIRKGMNL